MRNFRLTRLYIMHQFLHFWYSRKRSHHYTGPAGACTPAGGTAPRPFSPYARSSESAATCRFVPSSTALQSFRYQIPPPVLPPRGPVCVFVAVLSHAGFFSRGLYFWPLCVCKHDAIHKPDVRTEINYSCVYCNAAPLEEDRATAEVGV